MPKLSIRGPRARAVRSTSTIAICAWSGRTERHRPARRHQVCVTSARGTPVRGGRYVLVDANSQNGIWAGGQRLPKITLQPGVPVLVGSYRLVLDDAPIPSETLAGGLPVSANAQSNPPPPPTPSYAPPPKGNPPTPGRAATPVRPGPAMSQQAILFGGVAIVLVLGLGVTMWLRSRPPVEPPVTVTKELSSSTPSSGPQTDPVSDHLAKARQHLEAREYDDAIAEAEQVLALDTANTEAADIKLRAGELKAPPPIEKPPDVVVQNKSAAPPPSAPPKTPIGPPPTVLRRPNETEEDWYKRNAVNLGSYERGKAALANGEYRAAITALEPLLRDEPLYQNAPALLQQARAGLREAAQSNMAEAAKLEASGDLSGALRQLQTAQQTGGVSTAAEQDRVRGKMKVEGAKAFDAAETNYSMKRLDKAFPLYQRAYDYLADDDPNKKAAKDKLEAIGRRQ